MIVKSPPTTLQLTLSQTTTRRDWIYELGVWLVYWRQSGRCLPTLLSSAWFSTASSTPLSSTDSLRLEPSIFNSSSASPQPWQASRSVSLGLFWEYLSHYLCLFIYVGWKVTLCDPIWQMTFRNFKMDWRTRS